MTTALHKDLPQSEIHTIVAWVYANEAARLAATGFVATDLYKVAHQTDTGSLFVLTGYLPIEWTELASGASQLLNKVEIRVCNDTGVGLSKGDVVYASGWCATHGCPWVSLADKADPDKRPAVGILKEDIADETNGLCLVSGLLTGFDTTSWSLSDQLVLGTDGALSRPPPDVDPFTGEVQNLAVVNRVHATEGVLLVAIDGLLAVTATQIFALAGTSGTPSGTNKYVTNDDSRNTNARTPTSHASTHNAGGGDALAIDAAAGTGSLRTIGTGAQQACAGNDSRLSDARTPTSHASTHQSGGGDSIKLDDLAEPDDNTDLNASTSKHGLLPKLGGGTSNFLRADGSWATPSSVFGSDYQTATSVSRSTTTSTSFQNKTSLITPALTGTYRVGWTAVVDQNSIADYVEARLYNTTDAAEVGATSIHEPQDTSNRIHVGAFAEVVFTGSAKTFIIQYRQQGGNTAGIQDARIEIWRVS